MQANTYAARLDRALIAALHDEGVLKWSHFKTTQRAAGANFSVDVAAGKAIVQGDDQAEQGNYYLRSTAVENVALDAAPGSNSRYDIIILQANDPNAGGAAGSNFTVTKVTGTVAASPTVPATPNSALLLATVGPITSGTASITDSIIVDNRVLAGKVCTPGTIEHLAGTHVPSGWLSCDGAAVSRTTYADLFAEVSTAYGVGDGSTTFNLPDLRGKLPVAKLATQAQVDTVGETGGAYTHPLIIAELASHDHGNTTNQSADHQHVIAIQSGLESANHSHSIDHTHNVDTLGQTDGTHTHGGFTRVAAGAAAGTPLEDAATAPVSHTGSSGTVSANHSHAVNGTSGNNTVSHVHGTNLTGSGTAHQNMQPYQVVGLAVIRT